jgi:AcrR family transcriptional regulator
MPKVLSLHDVADFRQRLLDAAARRFAEEGVSGISLRRLASDLGVSATTPYRYFHDKDEILAALRAQAFDRFAASLEQAYEDSQGQPPLDRAAAVSRAYIDFALGDPGAYRLMFDTAQGDEQRYPDLARAGERARRTMTRHVDGMIGQGIIGGDADLLGHVFWSAMHGLLMLRLAGKIDQPAFDRVLRASMDLLMRGAAMNSSVQTPAKKRGPR